MKILKIIAALVVAAALSGGATASADVATKSAIRVLATGHQILYPDELVFHLEAEADTDITEIRLLYSLGGRSVQVYGYPDFMPGRRVSADFSVRTSGASYIPTGVDVEYYYRIIDSDQNTLETARSSFEYRDPRYRWNMLTRGDLTVVWHDISRRRIEGLAAEVVGRMEEIKSVFGLDQVEPMKAVIVNSRREAQIAFPFLSETSRHGNFFAGFAFGEYGLFVMQGLSADTMLHEAAHLLLEQAVDSPLARIPAWLDEGLAVQFEDGAIAYSATVRSAARTGGLLKLSHMGAVPGQSRDIDLFYAQAWSIVDYIMDNYGPERMGALLGALNSGQGIDEAFQTTYGFTLDDLEGAWRAGLLGARVPAPRLNPGGVVTVTPASGDADAAASRPDAGSPVTTASTPGAAVPVHDTAAAPSTRPNSGAAGTPATPSDVAAASRPGASTIGTAALISGAAAAALAAAVWRFIWQRLRGPAPEVEDG